MRITLDQVIPIPLQENLVSSSGIWGRKLVLEEGLSFLAHAPSGKGKSTLLHILYGMRNDFTGQIILGENKYSDLQVSNWKELRAKKISMLFQDLRLFAHLTVRENLDLLPSISQESPSVEEMCEQLEVADLLDREAGSLSLGQRQRVALVRSLRKPFQWLLLDEPFSHLDMRNAERAADLIERTRRNKGAGIILTSLHPECPLACDRMIRL